MVWINQEVEMKYITIENPTEEEVNKVRHKLQEHNSQFWEVDRKDQYTIYSMEDQTMVGGIVFTIFGEWLDIDFFWVDKEERGKGIGKDILSRAEAFAKNKGCKKAALNTFDFQAMPFYKKNGYEIMYKQDKYPVSSTKYYMEKKL